MSMFCFQCQETARNTGCTTRGVCGKSDDTANLQDLLIHINKGIAFAAEKGLAKNEIDFETGEFITKSLFMTITNANFDSPRFIERISQAIKLRDTLVKKYNVTDELDALRWKGSPDEYAAKSIQVGVLADSDEDVRSLHQLLIIGLKGIAAYAHHAKMLGFENAEVTSFIMKALASTLKKLTADEMTSMVLQAGDCAVKTMALLDEANSKTYGNKEITKVNIGVGENPGIIISGHDLHDMKELLEQTAGTGVDVYTHSEMLPAHYYPAFKKYPHFVGNYGGSWWKQQTEFDTFNGPILMTTNCIVPVKDSYKDRMFTTGAAGYPGVKHIADRPDGGKKDFSEIIALAKKCKAPVQIESGEIVGGFGHQQLSLLADKIIENVKSGAIKRFVVMGGCDGRHKERDYFEKVASALPKDTIILTAGCAKYRYNKLNLGDINGIPRVIDAGQCNDSYSLAVIALKLKDAFGLDDVNKLPLSFDIGWYEQKAVAVLLALIALGFKGMRLGPTLPAFVSPNVLNVLVKNFNIKPISDPQSDIAAMMTGN